MFQSGSDHIKVGGDRSAFTGLSINRSGTAYTLGATSSPVFTAATSNAFNIP